MLPTSRRTLLLLLLLVTATQLLLLGGGRLGLVPDAALLHAFQRVQPLGKDPVLDATEQLIRSSSILLVTNYLVLKQATGTLLGLVAGAAAALYFSWRRRATWWLLPPLLLGTLSAAVLGPLHQCFGALAWRWSLLATGSALVVRALLLLLGAGRVARR